MFRVTAKHVGFRNFSVETNNGSFIELSESGALRTENIRVDDIDYPNTIVIKGSNRRNDWSRKVAKMDASDDFYDDFQYAYFNSEEFREFVATPQLRNIANEIDAKYKSGKYGGEYGNLEF